MSIRLAIQDYPFDLSHHGGPKVFVRRLTESIIQQKLAKVSSTKIPFYNIALFSIHAKGSRALYNRILNKPYVLRVDGIYFDKYNTAANTEKMNNAIFSSIDKASGLVFISEFCKNMVERFHTKIIKPHKVIHNTVDTKKFTPIGPDYRKIYGISNKEKVIITSAHWRRHKRLKETLEFFEIICNSKIDNYKLIVLGGGADVDLNNKNIIYPGEIEPDSLPAWYRTADIYLHLAWIEPCGNTQIEAMACGLPVLCTNNGGIGETVLNADGGIVSKCDKPFEMKLLDYYNPPKPDYKILMQDFNMIMNNQKRFVQQININSLDIDVATREYISLIKQVHKKK